MDSVLVKLSETVRAAGRSKRALRLRGGGTKDFYGQALEGELLDTRGYSGIVAYDPSELVITARCGAKLGEIETAMSERRQMLAFEPPHFGEAATLGGMVAAGLSGPRRQAAGAVRDFVLGGKIMDGRGGVLAFGGQVMKNVAGYDVSRLMAGGLRPPRIIPGGSPQGLPLPPARGTPRLRPAPGKAVENV